MAKKMNLSKVAGGRGTILPGSVRLPVTTKFVPESRTMPVTTTLVGEDILPEKKIGYF